DVEAILARKAVGDPAERGHDRAQAALVHIDGATPGDAARIDAERVAPVDVVVDQRREQIVGRADGMDIAGEMQIDVLHRHDLRIAAAGGAALDPEAGAERGLAKAQHRLLADMVERVGEADRGRGLALARRRRGDRRNQDQLAVGAVLERFYELHRHLGLVVAVRLEVLRRDAGLFARDVHDWPHLGRLRDLDVGSRIEVLRGSDRGLGGGGLGRSHTSLVAGLSLAVAANSPAATLGPSWVFTRRTLMRPSAQTTVKPSVETSAISPILPAMPLGSRAGKGLASNTCSGLPSSVVHAPGAGLQPRMRL